MRDEPRVDCREFIRGADVSFGERVQLGGIGAAAARIEIGDNVSIGDDVRILAPRVRIGDYTVIHNHTTIYGYDAVRIGACGWIGQNAVLNCTAPLDIGNGCTISAYSTLWTHFSGGDPLQGCRFDSVKPCSLGDDVWIGAQCSVAPVSIGAKSLLLAGSVLTKDTGMNEAWGGNPAQNLTHKLGAPYRERSVEEKFTDLCALLREHAGAGGDSSAAGVLRLGGIAVSMTDCAPRGDSVFDVRDRSYSKLRSPAEIAFMRFLLPRVKFYPR